MNSRIFLVSIFSLLISTIASAESCELISGSASPTDRGPICCDRNSGSESESSLVKGKLLSGREANCVDTFAYCAFNKVSDTGIVKYCNLDQGQPRGGGITSPPTNVAYMSVLENIQKKSKEVFATAKTGTSFSLKDCNSPDLMTPIELSQTDAHLQLLLSDQHLRRIFDGSIEKYNLN